MAFVRRALARCVVGLIATMDSGCATTTDWDDARRQDESRRPPASLNRQPPAWLQAGSVPAPANNLVAVTAFPEVDAAQLPAQRDVPRVEEMRSPANNPVEELVPSVQPASGGPEWSPAKSERSR